MISKSLLTFAVLSALIATSGATVVDLTAGADVIGTTTTADTTNPCPGATTNPHPIFAEKPTFVKSVPNGKLYKAGNTTSHDWFYVVHLYGTSKEMGTAYGQMFKEELPVQIQNFDTYISDMITGAIHGFPSWLAELIVKYGAGYLLEYTYNLTAPYTQPRYIEEIDAISEAAGLDKWKLRAVSQFPEAIKAACTIVGANKDATKDGVCNGNIAHLRGLDFGVHPNIKNFPTLTVYHPTDGTPAVANLGWLAFTGALTGMNSVPLSLGEKVWDSSPIWNGSISGEAWTWVNREILRQDNMDAAIKTIDDSKRTCGIHLGIGDNSTNTFRGFRINAKQVEIYNWTTINTERPNYPEHPELKDIMYWDKYAQPTHSYCLGDLLKEDYGKIDAEYLATTVSHRLQTGDIHSASFDLENNYMFIANARKTYIKTGSDYAYGRQYTRLNMSEVFAEPAPEENRSARGFA